MELQTVQDKRDVLLEKDLCDHCLGRQFAKLGHGLENYERGAIVREIEDLDEDSFVRENVPDYKEMGGECSICQGVFNQIDKYSDMTIDSFDRYELSTFLIGIRPPEDVVEAEENLWEESGLEWVETAKTELSRLIGKQIEEKTGLSVDFERADIMAIIDMRDGKDRIELQVNSVLVYGQYNKYSREIPQTVWHCRNCRGDGCDECDWTGKNYRTSVQEEIQEPFKRETKAIEAKFHGGGREDVNAKCLGKREFVLELIEPLNRDLDFQALADEVNNSQDKVEIFNVREAEKDEIAEIKQKHADKAYRAEVELEEDVSEEELKKLDEVVGTINQFTPNRVQHRRAEKTRDREVYEIEYKKLGKKKIELKIWAEAGTYIKELISSDEGNTEPSIAGLLGTDAVCTELDVIEIEK